jgi:hypothetical protein
MPIGLLGWTFVDPELFGNIMSRTWLAFCVLTLMFLTVALEGGAQSNIARKFDEFGDIEVSDLIARLDNFAIQLQNESTAKGFVMVYRTRRDLPGFSNAIALRSKDYLINRRGIGRDRIVTVDGGEADCHVQELWIVPIGTAPTPRADAYQRYFPDVDSARKIDEYGFEIPGRRLREISRAGYEQDAEYLETFVKFLREQRGSTGCIIAYAQYNPRPGLVDYGNYEPIRDVRLDPRGTARARLNIEKRRLIKVYGIRASRLRLIDGGYRKRRSVELWVVPRGEHPPIPTPNSFPPRRK